MPCGQKKVSQPFSRLCKHTGLPCGQLKRDNLLIPKTISAVKDLLRNAPDTDTGHRLPKTLTTLSGDLMLFTPSSVQPKGDQPVTAKELLFLTESWVRLRKGTWRRHELCNTDAGTAAYIGMMKQNMEFPDHWMADARDFIPPGAILGSLSFSEYICGKCHKTKKDFLRDRAEAKERVRYPTWMIPCGLPSTPPSTQSLEVPKIQPHRVTQKSNPMEHLKTRRQRLVWSNKNASNQNIWKNGTSGRPGSPVDFDSTSHPKKLPQDNASQLPALSSIDYRDKAALARLEACVPQEAADSDFLDGPHFSATDVLPHTSSPLCQLIANEDGEEPLRFQELGACQNSSTLCSQQINDNATIWETSHRATLKPSFTRTGPRLGRHRRHKIGGSDRRSLTNAGGIEKGLHGSPGVEFQEIPHRARGNAKFLEAYLKALIGLKMEAAATLQRVKLLLEKVCKERVEDFKSKQAREYSIRWKLRLRQLENFHYVCLHTSRRPFSGLALRAPRSASPLLPIQAPSPPPLVPILSSPGARRAVRPRSTSPRPFFSSQNRGWMCSPVIGSKNAYRRQHSQKCHCCINADGLLIVNRASSQLSRRELETITAWEREECERLKKVLTFRVSVEAEARNQTMKPFYELLSAITDLTGEVSRELCFLTNTKRNHFAIGDAVFKSNAVNSLEHIQLLMAASSGSSRNSIGYLPRFHALHSSKTGLHPFNPPRSTAHSNHGNVDDLIRPLNQRSLRSLGRQLKRLESQSLNRFYDCLESRRALLSGRDATLPKSMIRAAEWRLEMMGLEFWSSKLSTNSDFSYFELSPLAGEQKMKNEIDEIYKSSNDEDYNYNETEEDTNSDYND